MFSMFFFRCCALPPPPGQQCVNVLLPNVLRPSAARVCEDVNVCSWCSLVLGRLDGAFVRGPHELVFQGGASAAVPSDDWGHTIEWREAPPVVTPD